MAQAAARQDPASSHGYGPEGPVAAGGPIAELQRTIEERMMGTTWHTASTALAAPAFDGVSHRISRFAGPALLAVAYAAVALWWF